MNESEVGKEIGKAVLVAGLSAAVVKLVEWAVEELKQVVEEQRVARGGRS